MACWFRFRLYFVCSFTFAIVSLDQFISVFLAFVVLGLVASVGLPCQEIGWEERFRK